ncbi:cytochrome P450 [Gordonia pseudamarae]|jgi:cytochrome P450|uniref:Cytochrome P450 n=1 Tax=Gordonia pseudamarae TaxID=2831662 RepID=A0ABX6IG10_9ACTN|nr:MULTISPECIES: cytochrome P450 [Gordonia]MBD0021751.1 cytochrome P450 [Gordonia sp. (in: high G+C Gram-positive bacteria)]QHN25279.1 cytochrome P450 [Gordonia pseudamarae]QHN34210.1 cytochrome P450 [Gordonia pseudamarae]
MSTTEPITDSEAAPAGTCPVHEFNHYLEKPYGEKMAFYDAIRDEAPIVKNSFADHFIVTRYEEILASYQNAKVFSNSAVTVFNPNPTFRWIPQMLDGDEHKQWRKNLNPLFSPKNVERLEEKVRHRAVELVQSIAAKGKCDFLQDFALQFPSFIFLELMGMPFEDLDKFLYWEDEILHISASPEEAARRRAAATAELTEYFRGLIEERRADPRDDLISKAISFEINGEPTTQGDLESFCILMFMAGLDTVTATLANTFLYLATNQDDRQAIVDDPDLIPSAIEEILRVFAIVIPSRKTLEDTEIAGCPIPKGSMVCLPLNAATRDERQYDHAKEVHLDRSPNNHIAFGAGPHRCLGSHLARRELRIALEEWHKYIPNYRLSPESHPTEKGGQLGPVGSIYLEWDV